MKRASHHVEELRRWLAAIAEDQFVRHRRWMRGLTSEQERIIREMLLPSLIERFVGVCGERPLAREELESPRSVRVPSGGATREVEPISARSLCRVQ